MKQCSKCKKRKGTSEFYNQKSAKDGLQSYCKECTMKINSSENRKIQKREASREYSHTERGVKIQYEYRHSENRKTAQQKYNKSDKGKTSQRKYDKSKKGKDNNRKYREGNQEKIKAQTIVTRSIRKGDLPKASTLKCTNCNKQAADYHHWSYDKKYWLDVIPLCRQCHKDLHKEKDQ